MAAPKISDLTLGNFLKIVSMSGVYNNLSEDSSAWDNVKKMKKGNAEGREKRFLLRSSLGPAAVGFVAPNGGDYLAASQGAINEGTAQYKDFSLTVEVERSLIAKAMSDMSRYGEPLADEMRAKTIALSRQLSMALYGDGTGVIAQAADAGTVSSGKTVFNVSTSDSARGSIAWAEIDDKVLPKNADGTAAAPTLSSGSFDHYVVTAKDRAAGTITLEARNSSGTALTVTATGITAGDYLYRKAQSTISDLSSIGSTDYNTLSEAWPGLEALTATDGRKVNGITMTGNLSGTRHDAGGDALDSVDFQKVMSKLMIAVGAGRYKYDKAQMSWEALDTLVDNRETDKRFIDVQDNKRGVASLGYIHGKNTLIFNADEFCPLKRVFIIPNGDVLQFHGSNFEIVKTEGGSQFHLVPNSSGGYKRKMQAMMEGSGTLHTPHSAAIGVISNFTTI